MKEATTQGPASGTGLLIQGSQGEGAAHVLAAIAPAGAPAHEARVPTGAHPVEAGGEGKGCLGQQNQGPPQVSLLGTLPTMILSACSTLRDHPLGHSVLPSK